MKMCDCDRCQNGEPVEYGKCHCGCGVETPLSTRAYLSIGRNVNDPIDFCHEHSGRKALPFSNAKIMELYTKGSSLKEIAEMMRQVDSSCRATDRTVTRRLNQKEKVTRSIAHAAKVGWRKSRESRVKVVKQNLKFATAIHIGKPSTNPRWMQCLAKGRRALIKKANARKVEGKCDNAACAKTWIKAPGRVNADGSNFCSPDCARKVCRKRESRQRKLETMMLSRTKERIERPDWLTDAEWAKLIESSNVTV